MEEIFQLYVGFRTTGLWNSLSQGQGSGVDIISKEQSKAQ